MDVERVAVASVAGGDDERLAVLDEADVADEAGVEDLVNGFAVVDAAFMLADQASARGGLGHLAGCSGESSRVDG